MPYLTDFEEIDRGFVAFGGNPKEGKITGRGTIKTGNLDFKNVYFVKEFFNDTECIVLSPNFKLTDESHVSLKVPRKNNMYSVDLKNIIPKGGLTCLFAKAISNESKLWHRRLGHINLKTMNKLVKGNLVRGLPSKRFEVNQTCVAFQKGKQHRASYERKNRTLIKAARTMLVDSKLPTTFWAEAVNTACYVQNRVLVTKPHNKTPMRPFGCPVTILNTIDHLGKFDGKADEGFFVGYSINRSGPNWLFDIDALTKSMNYKPIVAGNQSNDNAGTKAYDDAGKARMETVPCKDYILLPLWPPDPLLSQVSKSSPDAGFKPSRDNEKKVTEEPGKEGGDSSNDQEKEDDNVNSTNNINTASDGNSTNNVNAVSSTVNAPGIEVNVVGAKTRIEHPNEPNIPELEDIVYSDDAEDVGAEADMNNLNTLSDWRFAISSTTNGFKCQRIWRHMEEPKKDKRGIVIRNKARLVAQGYTQEERIDYDEVFVLVARIEAIRLFLAYASFKDFVVYQMDVKSAFLYRKIEEEVYQVNPKVSHLHVVKRIFSDYTRASLDRKSTIGGCQFLGCRLISWQCKKQTVVANSIIEAGCFKLLWTSALDSESTT
ncbi:ribonuclease H-like domain-containing protein [Tanacetum coccineum]